VNILPSQSVLEMKQQQVAEIKAKVEAACAGVIVDYSGISVADDTKLRKELREAGVNYSVVKNTLLHKAFEASEIDFSPLYDCLKGNTAVMFANTANVPAKLLKEYKKEGIPALKGAYAEESIFVGADKLEELVAIKSKNELIAEVVALLQSPIKNVVSGLNAGGKVHGLLDAIAERNK
jgi:large subunit ribosomal protein L10